MKGKPNLARVGLVELGEAGEFLRRQRVEACAGLLAARILGDIAGDRRPPGKVRMGAQQRELLGRPRLAHLVAEGLDHVALAGEGALRGGALGHPRRVLGDVAEGGDEIGQVHGVDRLQRDGKSTMTACPRVRGLF